MTLDEARIVLLENALMQAQRTVTFLHKCLTEPNTHLYKHPEQTQQRLAEWAKLAPLGELCLHSRHKDDCKACAAFVLWKKRTAEANRVLQGVLI